jgi:SAM-dependent methyltransferase
MAVKCSAVSAPATSETLLGLLRCPLCRASLSLEGEPQSEALTCTEGHVFPVVRGIPRLAPHDQLDAEQLRTAAAFGYSWTHYPKKNPYTEGQWRDWVVPLTPADFAGKTVLDAGCGLGGFAEYASEWGAARVVGVDLSTAIDAARERLGDAVDLVQADIYALPFERGSFDLAYSIGVLHHLPDPEGGFRAVVEKVKPGGQVFAWVYGRENNGLIVHALDPLRRHLFSRLPRGLLKWGISLPLATVLWPFVRAAKAGASFPYSAYFRFLAQRDFAFTHGVVFDHLVAPTSHYIRREDFEGWFARAGLVEVEISWRNRNSWRGLGRVPDADDVS